MWYFSCLDGFFVAVCVFVFFLTLFLFCSAYSFLRGDQDSVRQSPEANHVSCLGNKTIFCVKKNTG